MKQLELPLKIEGTFEYSDADYHTTQLIQEREEKPKGLEDLSWNMINQLNYLHRGRM